MDEREDKLHNTVRNMMDDKTQRFKIIPHEFDTSLNIA